MREDFHHNTNRCGVTFFILHISFFLNTALLVKGPPSPSGLGVRGGPERALLEVQSREGALYPSPTSLGEGGRWATQCREGAWYPSLSV